MKLCHVTIPVKSLDESLQFYQDVIGLPLARRFSTDDGFDIAFVGNGETKIELIYSSHQKDEAFSQNLCMGFEVASVVKTIEFLHQKGLAPGDVVQLGKQARCLFISDPNGIQIQFIEYIKGD